MPTSTTRPRAVRHPRCARERSFTQQARQTAGGRCCALHGHTVKRLVVVPPHINQVSCRRQSTCQVHAQQSENKTPLARRWSESVAPTQTDGKAAARSAQPQPRANDRLHASCPHDGGPGETIRKATPAGSAALDRLGARRSAAGLGVPVHVHPHTSRQHSCTSNAGHGDSGARLWRQTSVQGAPNRRRVQQPHGCARRNSCSRRRRQAQKE